MIKSRLSFFHFLILAMIVLGGANCGTVASTDDSGDEPGMTARDFHVPGTQVGDIAPDALYSSGNCRSCHGDFDTDNEPYSTWQSSLMGQAGRDPLFFAQMTNAVQDVPAVGSYCLRCHVPLSIVTGNADTNSHQALNEFDREGVACHFCHSMVDPIYEPGISPAEDVAVLNALEDIPAYYGNAMFVLDPSGLRRGPYTDSVPPHAAIDSPFHRTGNFCGTCHDVGNVAISRQPDGTYRYNAFDEEAPDHNPHSQFPLERTYTEWKLSTFANGGVDMGGRFGGTGATVVSTCQDCHMPRESAKGCFFGPTRDDLASHSFAGASAWVLEIIGKHYENDPAVDQAAIQVGMQNARDMLARAASLELTQNGTNLQVRVLNESGHKLPTGHIEGRRVWANVRFLDAGDGLLKEYGHYDEAEAHLDTETTTVYEMHIGLSDEAAAVTGLPAGITQHMSLANTIVKDSRIPPRGFNNAAYEAAGAPAVGTPYADGQYWHDSTFPIPGGALQAEVNVYYQTVTRHYIESLRDGNVTDHWGDTLHALWESTGRCPPILITSETLAITP